MARACRILIESAGDSQGAANQIQVVVQTEADGVEMPRELRASAIWRRLVAPARRTSLMIGRTLPAARSASPLMTAMARSRAWLMFGLPSLTPRAFSAARGALS